MIILGAEMLSKFLFFFLFFHFSLQADDQTLAEKVKQLRLPLQIPSSSCSSSPEELSPFTPSSPRTKNRVGLREKIVEVLSSDFLSSYGPFPELDNIVLQALEQMLKLDESSSATFNHFTFFLEKTKDDEGNKWLFLSLPSLSDNNVVIILSFLKKSEERHFRITPVLATVPSLASSARSLKEQSKSPIIHLLKGEELKDLIKSSSGDKKEKKKLQRVRSVSWGRREQALVGKKPSIPRLPLLSTASEVPDLVKGASFPFEIDDDAKYLIEKYSLPMLGDETLWSFLERKFRQRNSGLSPVPREVLNSFLSLASREIPAMIEERRSRFIDEEQKITILRASDDSFVMKAIIPHSMPPTYVNFILTPEGEFLTYIDRPVAQGGSKYIYKALYIPSGNLRETYEVALNAAIPGSSAENTREAFKQEEDFLLPLRTNPYFATVHPRRGGQPLLLNISPRNGIDSFGTLAKFYSNGDLQNFYESTAFNEKQRVLQESLRERAFDHIAMAVCTLNREGTLHLDLKAKNILVEESDENGETCFKVTDFGSAQKRDELPDKINYGLFTEAYLPPEMLIEGILQNVQSEIERTDKGLEKLIGGGLSPRSPRGESYAEYSLTRIKEEEAALSSSESEGGSPREHKDLLQMRQRKERLLLLKKSLEKFKDLSSFDGIESFNLGLLLYYTYTGQDAFWITKAADLSVFPGTEEKNIFNLYYLLGLDFSSRPKELSDLNFDDFNFSTALGDEGKKFFSSLETSEDKRLRLIAKLLRLDPRERMSIADFYQELQLLRQ